MIQAFSEATLYHPLASSLLRNSEESVCLIVLEREDDKILLFL